MNVDSHSGVFDWNTKETTGISRVRLPIRTKYLKNINYFSTFKLNGLKFQYIHTHMIFSELLFKL